MKKYLLLAITLLTVTYCRAQDWGQLSNFSGAAREASSSFSISDTGYIVAGVSENSYYADAWQYISSTGKWKQVASYPGGTGCLKAAFSLDGYGYVGTGEGANYTWATNFYRYSPSGNTWTQMADFPGLARGNAMGFGLDGKGYIGCGMGGTNGVTSGPNFHAFKDFYQYDPATNTWTRIADYPGNGSEGEVCFVIGDKAYVGGGYTVDSSTGHSSAIDKDFWEYDTTSKAWTRVADFAGGTLACATGASSCSMGYVGLGVSDTLEEDYRLGFWEYNPVTNHWSSLDGIAEPGMIFPSSFVLGNTLYAGLGFNYLNNNFYNDFWSILPDNLPGFTTSRDTMCPGGAITFTDTTKWAPTNWSWYFPGGTPDTSSQQDPSVEYDTPGVYNVYMSAWTACDSNSSLVHQVHINNSQNSSIISIDPGTKTICKGQSVTLTAQDGSNYTWYPTGLTQVNDSTVIVNPTVTATYGLTGTDTKGCYDSATSVITVDSVPMLSVTPRSLAMCQGGSDSLFVSGSTNYEWTPSTGLNSTSGDSIIASPTVTTTYYVMSSAPGGCSDTVAVTIVVNPAPTLVTGVVSPICLGDSATITVSGAASYSWTPSTGLNVTTGDSVIAAPSLTTVYTITGIDSSGCTASIDDTITIDSCTEVWPGDANDDLYVNNSDLLPIGLYYGITGPPRGSVSIVWMAQPATVWGTSQSNGKDVRYVDCNGDGTINADDTLAVQQNYGLYHAYGAPRSNNKERNTGAPLYLVIDSSSYHPGKTVHAAVWLGNSTTPVTIYGLSYNVELSDTSVIQNGSLSFNYDNSFIGIKNINALILTHVGNDIETAVVGTDHINKTGFGKIGDLYFTLKPDAAPQSLIVTMNYNEAVDSAGNDVALAPLNDTVTITNKTTGINQLTVNSGQLTVYPNPASDFIHASIQLKQTSDLQLRLVNMLGQTVWSADAGHVSSYQNGISVADLADGVYLLEMVTGGGMETKEIVVTH